MTDKNKKSVVEEMKSLLPDPKNRIVLEDFVSRQITNFLQATDIDKFPVQGVGVQKEDFLKRMQAYEDAAKDLQTVLILLARWGDKEQLLLLRKVLVRLAESDKGDSGTILWLRFGWYPLQLFMYSSGIAALSADNFDALKTILTTPIRSQSSDTRNTALITAVTTNLYSEIGNSFKWIPGHENKHFPRSEHLYEILRSQIEEVLFLGKGYDQLFDEFEIYAALVYSSLNDRDWAPVGRFAWKLNRSYDSSSFKQIIETAEREGDHWGPIKSGLFKDSKTFLEITDSMTKFIQKLSLW